MSDPVSTLSALPVRERVRAAMRLCRISQQSLGSIVGISARQIGYYVTGRKRNNPPYDVALAIAAAVGVSADLLFLERPREARIPNPSVRWRVFARQHGFPHVRAFIKAACNEMIETTEAYEHGYQPPVSPTGTIDADVVILRRDAYERLIAGAARGVAPRVLQWPVGLRHAARAALGFDCEPVHVTIEQLGLCSDDLRRWLDTEEQPAGIRRAGEIA